jgi:hypothetical protein
MKARKLFADNFNSAAHFLFGVLSFFVSGWLAVVFFGYQMIEHHASRDDVLIDVTEFLIGYAVASLFGLPQWDIPFPIDVA